MFSAPRTGESRNTLQAQTYYKAVLLVLAGQSVILQAAGLGPLRNSFWGFHLYAFIPIVTLVVAWVILFSSAVLLLHPGFIKLTGRSPGENDRVIPAGAVLALLTTGCVLLFWFLRSQQSLLGDSLPLMIDLPKGQDFHPRQPLTMWLQQVLYKGIGGLFEGEGIIPEEVAYKTTAVGSVLAGAIFVPVAYGLGRIIARGQKASVLTPWLITAVLLVQGYAVLFFGYVENYTFYALFVALYLLSALYYLRGRIPLLFVAVVLVTSTGLHLSTVGLIPSFLFLAIWGIRKKEKRLDAVSGFAAAAAGFVLLDWVLGKMSPGFDLSRGIGQMIKVARTAQGGGAGLEYMFTWAHVRDFVNEQFLIGPIAAFVLVPAAGLALVKRSFITAHAVFLILAAGVFLAGSWTMSEPLLGYARDWDLFAPAGVCYCVAALYFVVRHVRSARFVNGLLGFVFVLSLVHFVPWVWINHSEEAALARFKTLPLGYGRTEVTVGNWYVRNKNYKEAEKWFVLALEVNPRNANAHSLLGRLYAREDKFELAGKNFERAVMLRPDKLRFREYYVRALLELALCDEARPHLLWLGAREPDNVSFWHRQGDILLRHGCTDILNEAYEPVIRSIQNKLLKYPDDERVNIDAGIFLGRLEREEEALGMFRRALVLNPRSAAALFNGASTLTRLERHEEAEPLYRKFLVLYPDHDLADHVRLLLEN